MKLLPRKSSQSSQISTTDIEASTQLPGSKVDEDFVRPLRIGLLILILGFGGSMLWAALAPLGQGEPASGVVKVADHVKVVQHVTRATIADIKVHNGEKVQAGEVLVSLNPVKARAERRAVTAKYITAMVTMDRLIAEATGQDKITFDPQMQERFGDDPRYQRAVATQKRLFEARRDARASEVNILQENLQGAKAQLDSLENMLDSRRRQMNQINKQLEGVRSLAEQGYLPRNRMLELERQAASLQATLYSDMVQMGNTRNLIKELELKIMQHKREFRREVQAKLSEVQERTANLAARLPALDYAVNQTKIRAPVSGIVQDMQIQTVGGTIMPGKTLMKIVPGDAEYVIRAKLPVRNIDRIHGGLPVEITFPSLNSAWTPSIPGTVQTVSATRIKDKKSGRPFYRVEVAIDDEGKKKLAGSGVKLQAGMPAMVMIKLGERSLLSYLFKPLLVRLQVALSE